MLFRYGAVLADAWNGTWKQWGMWRFYLLLIGSMIVGYVLPLVVGGVGIAMGIVLGEWLLAAFGAATLLASIVFVAAASVVFSGGGLAMADAALQGAVPTAREGIRAGWQVASRLFGFYLVVWGFMMLLGLVIAAFVALFALPLILSGGDPGGAEVATLVGGVILGYLVFFVVVIALSLVSAPFVMTASAAIVVDQAGVRGALAQGWWAIRHRFGISVLTSLMIGAVTYLFSMAVGALTQGVSFLFTVPLTLAAPQDGEFSAAAAVALGAMIFGISALSLFAALPITVFRPIAWMSYYRQLTGRETPGWLEAQRRDAQAAVTSTPYGGPLDGREA